MENYPSNSKTAKSEGAPKEKQREKQIKQVTVGPVSRRKRPLGKRVMETFGGGDASGVFAYILQEVLLPAAKDMASDAVTQGVDKMLYGETRAPQRRSASGSRSSYTSYNRYSVNPGHRREPEPRREMSRRARASHDFDEIILASRAEADETLSNLFSLVEEYGTATVSDLYEMVGQTGDFTDERWGWDDMRGSSISRVKSGYLLDLPRPVYID